jgi:hypothetical protein
VSSGFALLLSIMAIIVSACVSSSDFRAEEDVKAHTARLLATLRSMMAKGAVLSQMPPGAPLPLGFTHERTFLSDFLTSTTGFAYWSWAGNKSQAAKDKPEEWRVFFLNLINILGAEDANFRSMMRGAIVLETMVTGLSKDDIRKIASYVADLSSAVSGFQDSQKKDVLISAVFEIYGKSDPQAEQETVRRKLLYLKKREIQDPDIDLFLGVVGHDVNLVKAALDAGADRSVTGQGILARYSNELRDYRDPA